MAEAFDYIKFEILLNNVWTDVSLDVQKSPPPRGNIGIMSNGFLDRVSSGGYLKFSLDNSEANIFGTVGYYSSLSPANLVRVSFSYENRSKYKFFGYIPPDGVHVYGGIYGKRTVDVTCQDWFGIVNQYKIQPEYKTNYTIKNAVDYLMSLLPAELQINTAIPVTSPFVDLFDVTTSDTTIIAELNKLAISGYGYFFLRPSENGYPVLVYDSDVFRSNASNTVIFKSAKDTTSLFLLADGTSRLILANGIDKMLLTETQTVTLDDGDIYAEYGVNINTGENFANRSRITFASRTKDETYNVVWKMSSSIKIEPGETINNIVARYRDPDSRANKVNCIEGVAPVANTDYQAFQNRDGTGLNMTAYLSVSVSFGTAEATISLTNTGGTDLYTGGDILFQLRGKSVKIYDTTDYLIKKTTPFDPYAGIVPLDFNFIYATDLDFNYLKTGAEIIVKNAAKRYTSIKSYPVLANRTPATMMAFMYLEPGTLAVFSETISGYLNVQSFINGYEWEIIGAQYVVWKPCLFRRDNYL